MPTPKHSSGVSKTKLVTKDGPFPKSVVVKTNVQVQPPELCSAQYTATLVQVPDGGEQIFIQASGVHPTSGFEVFFQRSPLDVYPPQFSLWHVRPSAPTLDVISPFSKFTSFKVTGPVSEVKVSDANGQHRVTVQKIGSAIEICE